MILFPTYAFLRYSNLPIVANTCSTTSTVDPFIDATTVIAADSLSNCLRLDTTVEITLGFPVYSIGLMSFIGWFVLIFFLPTGM